MENISRQIFINDAIDKEVADEVISKLITISDNDGKMAMALKDYVSEPIEIFINSPGGYATDGFAIIGAMEMCETPIVTYGLGQVASMALGIFVAGDYRFAHRYTRFMYHPVSYGTLGKIKDHEDAFKENSITQDMYDDLFKGTKINEKMMLEIKNNKSDYFFSAKEAVSLKVADEIILKPSPAKPVLNDSNQEVNSNEVLNNN